MAGMGLGWSRLEGGFVIDNVLRENHFSLVMATQVHYASWTRQIHGPSRLDITNVVVAEHILSVTLVSTTCIKLMVLSALICFRNSYKFLFIFQF